MVSPSGVDVVNSFLGSWHFDAGQPEKLNNKIDRQEK